MTVKGSVCTADGTSNMGGTPTGERRTLTFGPATRHSASSARRLPTGKTYNPSIEGKATKAKKAIYFK
jgi:hypothetical protein